MSFSLANGTGWTTGDTLTEAQINQIDQEHALAIDGSGGGTYDLVDNDLIISSSGTGTLELGLPVEITESLVVDGPGTFMDNMTVQGNLTVNGSTLIVNNTATMNGGVNIGNASSDVCTIKASTSLQAPVVASSAGRVTKRKTNGSNSDTIYGPKDWDIVFAPTLTANRIWTIDDTDAVNGDTILFKNNSGLYTIEIKDPTGSTVLDTIGSTGAQWSWLIRSSGSWEVFLRGTNVV